jgi:hypothetical protein
MKVTVQSFKEFRRFPSEDYRKTTLQKYLILCAGRTRRYTKLNCGRGDTN